jgi:glycosyltransferase involved in cell wall biosynthesis
MALIEFFELLSPKGHGSSGGPEFVLRMRKVVRVFSRSILSRIEAFSVADDASLYHADLHVDGEYYLAHYPDVALAGADPAKHYLYTGWREGRDPSANFDSIWYMHNYVDVALSGMCPLVHYLKHGQAEGRVPVPTGIVGRDWQLEAESNDLLPPIIREYAGVAALIKKTGVFDEDFYRSQVREPLIEPLDHFLRYGWSLGYNPNPLFDANWYLSKYPDVKKANYNPLVHYLKHGAHERRAPNPTHTKGQPPLFVEPVRNEWVSASGFGRGRPLASAVNQPYRPATDAKRNAGACGEFKFGVNFIAPVQILNGLGRSARGYLDVLRALDIPVNTFAWTRGFEHAPAMASPPTPKDRYDINVIHLNLDLLSNENVIKETFLPSFVSAERYNIAIIYWELASLDQQWFDTLCAFDEIWCASSFMARAVRVVYPGPVRVLRPAVEVKATSKVWRRASFDLPNDRFVFFYAFDAGSGLDRKNPAALLNAYAAEFDENAGAICLIKMSAAHLNPGVDDLRREYSERKDIVFFDRLLSEEEMHGLFATADCYVSPHRTEGLGLTILEAMMSGKPVIATPYGGVTDFVAEGTARLIDFRLREIGADNPPYPARFVWADPDIGSLRKALREIFKSPDCRKQLVDAARARVSDLFSLETTARDMQREIDRIAMALHVDPAHRPPRPADRLETESGERHA